MQYILTVLIELIFVSFSLLMVFDFVTGLQVFLPIFSGESEALAPTEPERAKAPPTALHQPIEVPDPWILPTLVEDATTTPLLEHWQSTKSTLLLPPTRDVNHQGAYSCLSIRQLKKLASAEGICRYSSMSKQQLVQALTA